MPVLSVGTPLGSGSSTCGYCGPSGERSTTETSFKKAGLIALQLSCEVRNLHKDTLSLAEKSLGLSKDDRPRVETIRDILLCSRFKTLVLSSVHYQVCRLPDVLRWDRLKCTCFNRRLDAVAFKPSRSQRKLINR